MIQTKASRPLDRDKLSMVSRELAIQEAHRALDALQNNDPEVQLAAACVLFAAYSKRCQYHGHDGHNLGKRLLEDARFDRKTNASVQSMLDFMGLRVMGDANTTIS